MAAEADAFPTVSVPTESEVFQILHRRQKKGEQFHKQPRQQRNATSSDVETLVVDNSDLEGEVQDRKKPKSTKLDKTRVRPGSYQALGLNPEICQAMQAAGYNFPTPIQRRVIPNILAGEDVVAMARTGSGKTAAFLAPLLHRLVESPLLVSTASRRNGPRALVVAPTRELVLQELKFCRLYSKYLNPPLRTAVVVGGTPLEAQFEALAVCPDIVFATPGRLLQLLSEMGAKGRLTLATAEMVVFDEADRLFEGTLAVETAALIANLRNKQTEAIEGRQTILISATMPHALADFSRTGLQKSLSVVRLDADKGISPTLAVAWICTKGDMVKDASLQVLIRRVMEESRTVVVFAATHRRVEYLKELLRTCVTSEVGCVHGNMDQTARVEAVAKFRKKITKVLVVTDVAARGIDLPELDVVINYDMAATPKLFIHRVGRVGRAGRFGLALTLITADELPYMLDVLLFIGRGVIFAERSSMVEPHNVFSTHAFAMETSFVIGTLPRTVVDDEVEVTRYATKGVDIDKAYKSAKNAHSLYTKTRGNASGESVRRGKKLFENPDGSRRDLQVHPWFVSMESETERKAATETARLSVWRPKDCVVDAPTSLTKRKRYYSEANIDGKLQFEGEASTVAKKQAKASPGFFESFQAMQSETNIEPPVMKMSARQIRLEEERKQFFLPTRQDASKVQSEKALKVRGGGEMGDGLSAFRELRDAAMDLTADSNADLLRSKHTKESNTAKYWDRVTKKFVKGGVTSTTSKRNLHVASREAKARAKAGESYGTRDGVLFKKWLQKNKSTVEHLAERIEGGAGADLSQIGFGSGLGKSDFRKGAFGRTARIAAAAREKEFTNAGDSRGPSARNELKSTDEIKKSRKLKAKAEARHQARAKKKKNSSPSSKQPSIPIQRGSAKSKVIIRRK